MSFDAETMDYPMEIKEDEALAKYILHLVDVLKLPNTIFIGASLGGFLAQLIARTATERVAGVCLYSTCSLSEISFTDEQRQAIREKLIVVGYELIREIGSWTAGANGADVKNHRKAYLGAGDPLVS